MRIHDRQLHERGEAPRPSRAPLFGLTMASALSASGCQVVEGVFKAGFWVGALVVVGIIALAIFALSKLLG